MMVGDWVCNDGASWTFRADGTYGHRDPGWVYDDGIVIGYAGQHWNLGANSFLDDVTSETTLAVQPSPNGLPCASIGNRTCARVDANKVPPELVGIWVLGDIMLEARADGYGRYRQGPNSAWQGGALSIGTEVRLQVCTEDLVLPMVVVGGALVVGGVVMEHREADFDELRIDAERVRRSQQPSSGGGGSSRSRRSHDFDFD